MVNNFISSLNWVDWVIFLIFLFYFLEGAAVGFARGLFNFAGFILSFAAALKFYVVFGNLLVQNFSLTNAIANALGFLITAFIFEFFFNFLSGLFFRKIPKIILNNPLNRLLGILPGLSSATVLVAFFLTLILSLPLSPVLKNAVISSRTGSLLTTRTAGFERLINQVFGQAANETINFITIKPDDKETVDLRFQTKNLITDSLSEQKMFELVNNERKKQSFSPLSFNNKLRDTARQHGRDMLNRGYFSHYTPEGLSPFDRLSQMSINFEAAAENLAFAPSLDLAFDGLIKSPGHRANILSSDFRQVGIGVIDAGIYGKMFIQEFTD